MTLQACRCQKLHLRLQPRCNRVQAASGRPCWSATSRGFTLDCRFWDFCFVFGVFLWSSPGLVCLGVSVLCCVWVLVRVCVCASVVFLARAFAALLCVSAVPVLLRRPFRGLASCVCLFGVLPGSVFRSFFSGVFSGISQDTWGSDESATRPEQSRKSSELRVQQMFCAQVRRTGLPS